MRNLLYAYNKVALGSRYMRYLKVAGKSLDEVPHSNTILTLF
jgi:hypothetical protein